MLVEELIKRLEELKEKVGNVEVSIIIEDLDGTETGLQEINEVEISTDENGENKEIYIAYFYKNDSLVNGELLEE